jgi:hypothetical protein
MFGIIAPDNDALTLQPSAFVSSGLSNRHKHTTTTVECHCSHFCKKSLKTFAMIFLTVALLRGSSVAPL